MRTYLLSFVLIIGLTSPVLAAYDCNVCGELGEHKSCGSLIRNDEATAKAEATEKMKKRLYDKIKVDFKCEDTFKICANGCPKKPNRSKIKQQGVMTQTVEGQKIDPQYKLCMDSCVISKNKCTVAEKKAAEKKGQDSAAEIKVTSTECKIVP